jgi:Winged helix domain, variant/ATPase family associated with various cellular activities (AAA)
VAVAARTEPFATGLEHLLAELGRIELLLRRQVLRLRADDLLATDDFRGLYIADTQVDALLHRGPPSTERHRTSREVEALGILASGAREENASRAGEGLPLVRLARLYGLDDFERDVLLLAVAPEIDLRYETLFAYVQNDVTKKHATVELAFKALCEDIDERARRRGAFASDGVLRCNELVRLVQDPQDREPPLPAHFIKADGHIVDFLLEQRALDESLASFTAIGGRRELEALELPPEIRERLARAAHALGDGGVIVLEGPRGAGKRAAAESVFTELGKPLVVVDVAAAVRGDSAPDATATRIRREAQLRGAGLYLEGLDELTREDPRARFLADALARQLPADILVLVGIARVPDLPEAPFIQALRIELRLPDVATRLRLWRAELQDDGDAEALANDFTLGAEQVPLVARAAETLARVRGNGSGPLRGDFEEAARAISRQDLRRLATKIASPFGWDDIVLPARQRDQLHEVCSSVRFRHIVHAKWGFERKLALGGGLNVLFSGESGTGKTMAVGIIAREIGFDAYKVEIATILSRYIGETEQNLSRIFDAARASNAILFFDEADALFGKRSEVNDAHDKYANIEVAYLLQQLETHDGIVVLATNLSTNIDDAFARRMHHVIEFPFPRAEDRERIWRNVFPADAPLAADVDLRFLARQFELSGGNIRNAALAAAFLAAEDDAEIRMEHVIRSTARELQKLGRLPSRADFGVHFSLIEMRA